MLQLCDPFMNLNEKPCKVLKVNSCYCAVGSTLQDIENPDTTIHLVQDLEESRSAQRTEDSKFFVYLFVCLLIFLFVFFFLSIYLFIYSFIYLFFLFSCLFINSGVFSGNFQADIAHHATAYALISHLLTLG